MSEADRIIDPTTRLLAYGVRPSWIKLCQEILPIASSPREVTTLLGRQGTSMDQSQLLMPLFSRIYKNEEDIKNEALQKLAGLGIAPEVVDEYLSADQLPYLTLHLKYEDKISLQTRETFDATAAQFVVDTDTLGVGLGLHTRNITPKYSIIP